MDHLARALLFLVWRAALGVAFAAARALLLVGRSETHLEPRNTLS